MNFASGGMMGDFIHSLAAVKNICKQNNILANVYISNSHGGDVWKFDLLKTYNDTCSIIEAQDYIQKYSIYNGEKIDVNLNDWRNVVAHTHSTTGKYDKCWTKLLSECYGYEINEYKWLDVKPMTEYGDKIIIHKSKHRHNGNFNWEILLKKYNKENILFLTTDINEWNLFKHKQLANLLLVNTISDMAKIIKSCKLFIGNQSAPFALASGLDVPRIVELDYDPAPFYTGEELYSKNISWYLNDSLNYLK